MRRHSGGSNAKELTTVDEDEDKATEEAVEKMMEPLGVEEGRDVGNKIQIRLNDLFQLKAESKWPEEVMDIVNEAMVLMTMKKREQGSVGEERKYKSLKQRWFTLKGDKASNKKAGEGKDDVGPQSKAIIEQDVVVSLEGGDYVVMGMFKKHYNKHFLLEQQDEKKLQDAQKEKTRLHVRKVMFDATLHMCKLEEGGTKDIYKQVKIGDVKSVKGKLQVV